MANVRERELNWIELNPMSVEIEKPNFHYIVFPTNQSKSPRRWIRPMHNAYMLGQFRNWIYSDATIGRTVISANLRRNKSESNDHLSRVMFARAQTPDGNLWDSIFTCICERTNWSSREANDIKGIIWFRRNRLSSAPSLFPSPWMDIGHVMATQTHTHIGSIAQSNHNTIVRDIRYAVTLFRCEYRSPWMLY